MKKTIITVNFRTVAARVLFRVFLGVTSMKRILKEKSITTLRKLLGALSNGNYTSSILSTLKANKAWQKQT